MIRNARSKRRKRLLAGGIVLLAALLAGSALCLHAPVPAETPQRIVHLASGGRVRTLDPALADDLASRNAVGALFDTLLQYDYTARPYQLEPSMLRSMPVPDEAFRCWTMELRDDLFFAPDPCFGADGGTTEVRRITSRDVRFSLLRLADARSHSPLYWVVRGKIDGIDDFHAATAAARPGDLTLYDRDVPGFVILDDTRFQIRLTRSDPRFLYNLALPATAVVSRKAVAHYGDPALARHPVGSGPFTLGEWQQDYRLVLRRNPEYRREYFAAAEDPADRTRRLPLADEIHCYSVKQPLSAWLMFLCGDLDVVVLDKDNVDMVSGGAPGRSALPPALAARGVTLLEQPEFEIQYVGFNFADPKLGKNRKLRQAVALAYNVDARVAYSGNLMRRISGPIPPGVAGYEEDCGNPAAAYDPERAARLLAEAGYPGGIDPETGKPLELTFDLPASSTTHRQLAEMAVNDLAKIGIKVIPALNNGPRFYQKLRSGSMQLFRLSWVGDYPDAENFLQLFYGGNAGGSNRVNYRDPAYDAMYEAILPMADSPERTERYRQMARYLVRQTPWIFETRPVTFQLKQSWLGNYQGHDFGFNRWKYWSVDPAGRDAAKAAFRPLSLEELRHAR